LAKLRRAIWDTTSPQGVEMDPRKIDSIMGWPKLKRITQKNAFGWSAHAKESFNELKQAMTQAPVLALLDFSKPFIVECDASGLGIGAVLLQEN
jgi:hypothetical protein